MTPRSVSPTINLFEPVYGGGAEHHICRDPRPAAARPQPRRVRQQRGRHHQHGQTQVRRGQGHQEPAGGSRASNDGPHEGL